MTVDGHNVPAEMPAILVPPDTTTTRVFGILNLLFALLASCIAAYAIAMAFLMPAMFKSMEQTANAQRQANAVEIDALRELEEAAESDEQKAEFRARREELAALPRNVPVNPFGGMEDPRMQVYGLVDGSTGLFFNLLMFSYFCLIAV